MKGQVGLPGADGDDGVQGPDGDQGAPGAAGEQGGEVEGPTGPVGDRVSTPIYTLS